MDVAVNAAISAVHIDDDTTLERWFECIRATYEQQHAGSDRPDWSQFCTKLTEGAMSAGVDSHVVEQFVEHMNANDMTPIETIGQMAEVATELPALYRELAADTARGSTDEPAQEPARGGENAADAYDESAWNAFLSEHGVRWDGTDASWEQFKAWFLYEAEQRAVKAPGTGFITYAEGQSDKVAVFAQYGVTINRPAGSEGKQAPAGSEGQQAPDAQSFPEVKPGDSGEWVEYLDAMLTSQGF